MPELAEWSERHRYPFGFVTEASVDLADDEELLQAMRRAGFYSVFVGIETPAEESLKEAQKGQNTRRDLIDSIRRIRSYGMEVMAGFIVGFDHAPENIFDLQIALEVLARASGVPYGSRIRVAAVTEKRPIVIQTNLAAWIALYRT